jgi:hypothetical protein
LGNVYFGDNGLVWLFSRSNSLGISEPVLLFLKTIQKKSLYCKTRITQLIRKDQCMSALFFFKKKCSEKWNPFKCSFERMQVRIFISNALESFFAMKVAFLEEAKKERDSKPPSSFWL